MGWRSNDEILRKGFLKCGGGGEDLNVKEKED